MMTIGPDLALAQLAATLAFADLGTSAAHIYLYTDAGAGSGAEPGVAPMATIELAKPCGAVAAGVLTLNVAAPGGALVDASGTPRAAQWVSGEGKLVAAGTVTDADHAGDFTVSGGATAPGDDSPSLYAGGLVLLGAVVLD